MSSTLDQSRRWIESLPPAALDHLSAIEVIYRDVIRLSVLSREKLRQVLNLPIDADISTGCWFSEVEGVILTCNAVAEPRALVHELMHGRLHITEGAPSLDLLPGNEDLLQYVAPINNDIDHLFVIPWESALMGETAPKWKSCYTLPSPRTNTFYEEETLVRWLVASRLFGEDGRQMPIWKGIESYGLVDRAQALVKSAEATNWSVEDVVRSVAHTFPEGFRNLLALKYISPASKSVSRIRF